MDARSRIPWGTKENPVSTTKVLDGIGILTMNIVNNNATEYRGDVTTMYWSKKEYNAGRMNLMELYLQLLCTLDHVLEIEPEWGEELTNIVINFELKDGMTLYCKDAEDFMFGHLPFRFDID